MRFYGNSVCDILHWRRKTNLHQFPSLQSRFLTNSLAQNCLHQFPSLQSRFLTNSLAQNNGFQV